MNELAALTAYAALVGFGAPLVLARARWPHQAPRLAIGLWLGLLVSFTTAIAFLVHHLVAPHQPLHDGVFALLHACASSPASALYHGPGGDSIQMFAPLLVAAWPLTCLGVVLVRAWRHRRRHAQMLALVAKPAPELAAVVVDHDLPAAYCLPGRRRRIVLTRGALDALTPDQLGAVLAHEQAHLRGRHHLVAAAVEAFAAAFPGLPLARAAREQTATLLEMAADDHAVRRHRPRDLAAAMCEVAAGRIPGYSLGAAKTALVQRAERLLRPHRPPHPAALASTTALALAVPLLPLLFSCGPGLN